MGGAGMGMGVVNRFRHTHVMIIIVAVVECIVSGCDINPLGLLLLLNSQTATASQRTWCVCGRMVGRRGTTRTSLECPAMTMSSGRALPSSTPEDCAGCWAITTRSAGRPCMHARVLLSSPGRC